MLDRDTITQAVLDGNHGVSVADDILSAPLPVAEPMSEADFDALLARLKSSSAAPAPPQLRRRRGSRIFLSAREVRKLIHCRPRTGRVPAPPRRFVMVARAGRDRRVHRRVQRDGGDGGDGDGDGDDALEHALAPPGAIFVSAFRNTSDLGLVKS
jgi:hypothetical protein